jgi:tRNA(Arg) A34 adenosine deaminase TadA
MHRHLRMASHLTCRGDLRRTYLVAAVGVRTDGTIVHTTNGRCEVPTPSMHAEVRLLRKLDYGSVVYVARTLRENGKIAMAKPCPRCQAALKARGIKKVFYTVSENEYGVMEF